MSMGTNTLLAALAGTIDSIESRVNDIAADVRDMKSGTAELRDRLSRIEGELNSARKTDVNVSAFGGDNVVGGDQHMGHGDLKK